MSEENEKGKGGGAVVVLVPFGAKSGQEQDRTRNEENRTTQDEVERRERRMCNSRRWLIPLLVVFFPAGHPSE